MVTDPSEPPLRMLLYSDDVNTRQRVRAALGRRVAPDLPVLDVVESATAWAVMRHLRDRDVDLVVLDGEAAKVGGLGLCRTIKEEIHESPPVLVILGRPQDDWLAAWSRADGVAMHPIDPVAMSAAVEQLIRSMSQPGPAAVSSDLARQS